ncbi:MAG: sugar phosphate nucleotidyltransferase [Candidatus Gracilibacteria bacterium]|jgi:mannose-1-phosphate guanylyltransferase
MKAVILAGGSGTRLYPLSTIKQPKQFQCLVSNKTLIEETISRLDFLNPKDIYIAFNENHLSLIKKYCKKIPKENFIIEPALRDTAPCIGFAAAIIAKKFPNETMAVIYADHLIKNKKEFQKRLKDAEFLSNTYDTLNIIEVVAKEPNPNLGYVKIGEKMIEQKNNTKDVYFLDRFVEKPNIETAKKFIKEKNYLWNTGIYVWKAETLLNQYKQFKPEMYKIFEQISKVLGTAKANSTIKALYPTLEKISIDYAIMEKTSPKKIRILKADLSWSDIGNWEAIYNELSKNKKDNVTKGKVKIIDCEGCLIYGLNKKQVSAIGLKDKIIIDCSEGLLICDKSQSKRVKEL